MILERKIGFPIVHIETDFLTPLRYGDTVHATIWLSKVGSKSCTWAYTFRNQNQEVVWESSHVTVCVDMDTIQPMEIPEDIRAGLLNHASEESA